MIRRFGAFELDDERYELRRNGRKVHLRRKVFDVLHHLVTHGDRVVSKEELLEDVWRGEVIQEAVIAQNIAIVRRALGDTRSSGKLIETVHGRGYRFVAEVTASEPRMSSEGAGTRPTSGPPFVGREPVMQELRALLRAARGGKGRLAVITGEAGIGKTRVTEEIALEAKGLGVRVLEGRCHEGGGSSAYWPWLQVLRTAAADRRLAAVRLARVGGDAAELLAALRGQHGGSLPTGGALDAGEARLRLFDDVTSWLAQASRAQPLLLIFDDLHWADEATLLLLRFVAREVRTQPLLVLGTSRDIEARVEPEIPASLRSLVGGTQAQRLYLGGLGLAALRALAAAVLGQEVDEPRLEQLHALTEGNPFFVHEILQLFVGDASRVGAREHGPMELPRRVRDVIGSRVHALGSDAERVLAVASVVGREFGLAVVERVAELPRERLLALVEAAVRARMVREVTDGASEAGIARAPVGRYEFAHALVRESLYRGLPEPERVRLHDRVGRVLEDLFGVDAHAHLDELAHHFYRAAAGGAVERAVSYCVRAAESALSSLAFEQAVLHYERALEALACRLPIDEVRRFELKLALGAAQFRAGEDGNPALLGAAAIACRLAQPERLGEVVLAMCGWPRVVRHGRTANPELYPLLSEALAAPLDDHPALRARLFAVRALNAPEETPLPTRAALSEEALGLARGCADDQALFDALLARLRLMQAPEDTAARLRLADEILALARRLGQEERIFSARELRVQPLVALGDLSAADEEIAACAQLAGELRLPRCKLHVTRLRLERAFGDGRFDEIGPLASEAARLRGESEISAGTAVALYVWPTFARAFRGDRAWFERHVAEMAGTVATSTAMRGFVAYLYAAFDRDEDARACYAPLLERRVLDEGRDDDWLMTFALAAEAIAECGDREAAGMVYPRLLPYRALNVSHFEWLIYFGSCAHWLGRLAALLGDANAARDHFEAALEMNAKLGARPALARTSLAYAQVLLRREPGGESGSISRSDAARARALLREARALAEELGMRGVAREADAIAP